MSKLDFFSNGKLLISGEYFVLHGAMSLAVPVRFGQSLRVETVADSPNTLQWISKEKGEVWFHAEFTGGGFDCVSSSGNHAFLQSLLVTAGKINPSFAEKAMGKQVVTNTGFPLAWGLGSSSTLISNIAYWADVNPYRLLFETTNGSGYDVACARSEVPVMYKFLGKNQNPKVQPVSFNPPFAGNLWFVYSGNKQNSAKSIEQMQQESFTGKKTDLSSAISSRMLTESSFEMFMKLMKAHELLVADAIGKTPVQLERFDDFPGTIKSLGAWGGDFIMAATHLDEWLVKQYFQSKGCKIVFSFGQMLLHQ